MTEEVICTSCKKFVKYIVKEAEDCITMCDFVGKNYLIPYTRKYAYCIHCGEEVYVPEIEDYNANEPIKQWHRKERRKQMKFGDMTISQIKEICDKTKDCSTCPLLLHIDPKVNPVFGPTVCVFNTHPRDWVPENPVKVPEQKGESK